jgi:glycosyltransferase involved in cell wall biosynthesis
MYPPHSDGGYPLLCREAVDELRSRGHNVLVLTGDMGCPRGRIRESNVWRIFAYCPDNKENELKSGRLADLVQWYRREWVEHTLLTEAITGFKPEVVFVWATKGLSHSLAIALQRTGVPFLAYVCGYWLNHHNQEAPLRRQFQFWSWGHRSGSIASVKSAIHNFLARRFPVDYAPLRFDALAYNSQPMREAIEHLNASRVAPVQIVDSSSMDRFLASEPPRVEAPFRMLFVGRLHPSKDPLTLIQAFGLLQADPLTPAASLTLVGWQHDPEYAGKLREAISALPRPSAVEFREPVSFEAMPALFARHQIAIAPSLVDPLPRVAAEAMATGLVCIVSDKTGISALLADRIEAMIFPAGDAHALAETLTTIMRDPALAQALQHAGRKKAREFFSTRRMVDEMEAFLVSSVERTTAHDQHSQRAERGCADLLGVSESGTHSTSRDASV